MKIVYHFDRDGKILPATPAEYELFPPPIPHELLCWIEFLNRIVQETTGGIPDAKRSNVQPARND